AARVRGSFRARNGTGLDAAVAVANRTGVVVVLVAGAVRRDRLARRTLGRGAAATAAGRAAATLGDAAAALRRATAAVTRAASGGRATGRRGGRLGLRGRQRDADADETLHARSRMAGHGAEVLVLAALRQLHGQRRLVAVVQDLRHLADAGVLRQAGHGSGAELEVVEGDALVRHVEGDRADGQIRKLRQLEGKLRRL